MKYLSLLLLPFVLTGCATTQGFHGGKITFNVNGTPYTLVQAESSAKPATAVTKTEKINANGDREIITVDMSTGISQKDNSKAYAAFKDWRTYGAVLVVVGILMTAWSPLPTALGLAMIGAGIALGTLSYVIPQYGGYVGLALVGMVIFAGLLWLHGLKTDPKKDVFIQNSKAISAISKTYGDKDNE